MNKRYSFWGGKGNTDKREQFPQSVSTTLDTQCGLLLWKSAASLLFVATASHVNDQFCRNEVINIRCGGGVGDYSDGCRTLLPAVHSLCNFIYNTCRQHSTVILLSCQTCHTKTQHLLQDVELLMLSSACKDSESDLNTNFSFFLVHFFKLHFSWRSNNFWLILNIFFQ